MSRSYKKNPYVTDHKRRSTKQSKRIANHRMRQRLRFDEDVPVRGQHKKYTESYDICDYKWRMSRKEAIEWYKSKDFGITSGYFKERYPTLELWLEYWEKCYKRK